MEVSATFVYGFGTDGGVPPRGVDPKTTLDGADKDTGIQLWAGRTTAIRPGGDAYR